MTSILPSWTKLRAASRVGDMRLLHSTEEGISPRFANPRGISLGQHVFPTCLFWSKPNISCLSLSSDIVSKYLDLDLVFDDFFGACSCIFCLLGSLLPASPSCDFGVDFVEEEVTKKSFRILLHLPSSSNTIPSSSKRRLFFWTFGWSSPQEWPNPPMERSEATTLCQGTWSQGPKGLRPIAVPTARAEVRSSCAMEP